MHTIHSHSVLKLQGGGISWGEWTASRAGGRALYPTLVKRWPHVQRGASPHDLHPPAPRRPWHRPLHSSTILGVHAAIRDCSALGGRADAAVPLTPDDEGAEDTEFLRAMKAAATDFLRRNTTQKLFQPDRNTLTKQVWHCAPPSPPKDALEGGPPGRLANAQPLSP